MPLTTDHHDHDHTIAFKGRVLTPGETFEPFPDEHPGWLATFGGVHDGMVVLRHDRRVITAPLASIADATTET
jgi:hypothetical protein